MAFVTLVLGFLLGSLLVLAAEGLALYLAIVRLRRKALAGPEPQQEPGGLYSEQWLASASNKQGIVWFLEPENVPKVGLNESQTGGPKELKLKKSTVQVQPVKKYAKIKDHLLILSDLDGSQATIKLFDCTILAVSSSNLSSKKWAKRYPLRLESKSSTVYDGSKTYYLYFDTAWEKESWCKALRLASSRDNKLINWYAQISKEFNFYLASFSAEFPSFLKPSALHGEIVEKTIRVDGSSTYSKARFFFKKLTKKASKSGVESRANPVLSSTRDTRKTAEKLVTLNDVTLSEGSVKSPLEDKYSSSSFQDVHLSNKGPIMSDAAFDDKLFGDDGTLCWNLLLSRLFFDAKRSAELNSLVKSRIQKTLSNMRTPSYIGGITCTSIDLGNLPPYIHKIRVLPMDLTEVWAVEFDIEYLGGLLLDIETRIEVCEPELQEEFINASSEPSYNEETSSLLEGIEYYSNQLNSSACLSDQLDEKDEEGEVDCSKQPKISTPGLVNKSKWKTILHTIAEQVSQVPLSLAIRIACLRGTLRLHIRPPPSDQLWFGFTSMPDIDWHLESSIGERKITSTHIALLMGNRFKAAVRDSLVLPNCESICIPWMLAEKDDWIPQKVAPFVRISQEAMNMSMPRSDSNDLKTKPSGTKTSYSDDKSEKVKDVVYVHKASDEDALKSASSHTETGKSTSVSSSGAYNGDTRSDTSASEELLAPLLRMDGVQEGRVDSSRTASPGSTMENPSTFPEEDAKPKRVGRRARMMDLGKKVGEKIEEKRRNLEEKSRHIVEKMLENSKS
ncbi:uncharacterized protein LOC110113903 [Dendrobium catenatum]|uniref:SMP-LTD domain-containing protein n=1 Tax=Dendrobium catenatum TaxID=906689 RepID=A0A2I0VUY8_9ASPA|nr:uncharacterized protein LOC110113903 [Dendrobium catenatum]PKU67221.1 hypothetical protein MA16_Dca018715 [Dendrobium catenatum]